MKLRKLFIISCLFMASFLGVTAEDPLPLVYIAPMDVNLNQGEKWETATHYFTLGLDGNFFLAEKRAGDDFVLWQYGPSTVNHLVFQADGNLVAYDSGGTPLWASGTHGGNSTNRSLILQQDGNLVIYASDDPINDYHNPLWATSGEDGWNDGGWNDFLGSVTFTGVIVAGETLTAVVDDGGDGANSIEYFWQRSDDSGNSWITVGNESTYTLTTTEISKPVKLLVTYFDNGGRPESYEYTVSPSAPVFVKYDATGANDGSSWADAYTSLHDAIDNITAGKEIWVARGIYTPTKDRFGNLIPSDERKKTFYINKGVIIYGGFAGTETLASERENYGNGEVNETVLSGDIQTQETHTDNCYNVVFIPSTAGDVFLDGLTVKDGYADGSDSDNNKGAAVYYNSWGQACNGKITITDCYFTNNYGRQYGNTVLIIGNSSGGKDLEAYLNRCTFEGNSNEYSSQSVLNLHAGTGATLNGAVTDCSFLNNYGTALKLYGLDGVVNVTVENCLFTGNTAGVENSIWRANAEVNALYINNTIVNNEWGGVYEHISEPAGISNVNFHNCIVWSNNERNYYSATTTTTTFTNCLVEGCGGSSSWQLNSLAENTEAVDGGNNIDTNPFFVDAENGDYRLYCVSPCVDVGNNSVSTLNTDIRGSAFGRKLNGADGSAGNIDLGAYEHKFGADPSGKILLTTAAVEPIFFSEITGKGTITDLGVGGITSHGFCWSRSTNPTINDTFTDERAVSTTGAFSSSIMGLSGSTTYYIRAYAANETGVYYGNEISFTTAPGPIFVKHDASGANNGTSWVDAYISLQDAITNVTDGGEIWVARGTYYPSQDQFDNPHPSNLRAKTFFLYKGIEIYGGFAGTESLASQRTNYGLGEVNETVLSGDIQFKGFHTDNCYNVIYINAMAGDITLDGLSVKDGCADSNTSHYNKGAGLHYDGWGRTPNGELNLNNCNFVNNYGIQYGNAVIIIGKGDDNTIQTNITNCLFHQNSSQFSSRSIVCCYAGADLTFNGNVSNCTFTENTGAALELDANGGEINVDVVNCLIAGNSTGVDNAVWNGSNYGKYINNTIVDNSSAGISDSFTSGTFQVEFHNCIVSGNTKNYYGYNTTTTTFKNCLIEGSGGSSNWQLNDAPNRKVAVDGGGNIDTDPLFVDTVNGDYRLYGVSPCVDIGNNLVNSQLTDIRGETFDRKINQFDGNEGTIDLGAYEYKVGIDPLGTIYTPAMGIELVQNGTELTWTVEEEVSVKSYQIIDKNGTVLQTVIADGSGSYSVTLESDQEVSLQIVDESGFSQNFSPEDGAVQITNYQLQKGWNLIAITSENADLSQLGQVWGWNGNSYETVDSTNPTDALWVYSDVYKVVSISGTKTDKNINLKTGWNMVGPTENINVPKKATAVFSWAEKYNDILNSDILIEGVGYWIFVD